MTPFEDSEQISNWAQPCTKYSGKRDCRGRQCARKFLWEEIQKSLAGLQTLSPACSREFNSSRCLWNLWVTWTRLPRGFRSNLTRHGRWLLHSRQWAPGRALYRTQERRAHAAVADERSEIAKQEYRPVAGEKLKRQSRSRILSAG